MIFKNREVINAEINNGTLFALIPSVSPVVQFCVLLRKELKYLII